MLQVSYIKDNFSRVVSNLNKRNIDFSKQLQEITDLDDLRKKIAKKGKEKYFKLFNEKRISKFLLDVSLGNSASLF